MSLTSKESSQPRSETDTDTASVISKLRENNKELAAKLEERNAELRNAREIIADLKKAALTQSGLSEADIDEMVEDRLQRRLAEILQNAKSLGGMVVSAANQVQSLMDLCSGGRLSRGNYQVSNHAHRTNSSNIDRESVDSQSELNTGTGLAMLSSSSNDSQSRASLSHPQNIQLVNGGKLSRAQRVPVVEHPEEGEGDGEGEGEGEVEGESDAETSDGNTADDQTGYSCVTDRRRVFRRESESSVQKNLSVILEQSSIESDCNETSVVEPDVTVVEPKKTSAAVTSLRRVTFVVSGEGKIDQENLVTNSSHNSLISSISNSSNNASAFSSADKGANAKSCKAGVKIISKPSGADVRSSKFSGFNTAGAKLSGCNGAPNAGINRKNLNVKLQEGKSTEEVSGNDSVLPQVSKSSDNSSKMSNEEMIESQIEDDSVKRPDICETSLYSTSNVDSTGHIVSRDKIARTPVKITARVTEDLQEAADVLPTRREFPTFLSLDEAGSKNGKASGKNDSVVTFRLNEVIMNNNKSKDASSSNGGADGSGDIEILDSNATFVTSKSNNREDVLKENSNDNLVADAIISTNPSNESNFIVQGEDCDKVIVTDAVQAESHQNAQLAVSNLSKKIEKQAFRLNARRQTVNFGRAGFLSLPGIEDDVGDLRNEGPSFLLPLSDEDLFPLKLSDNTLQNHLTDNVDSNIDQQFGFSEGGAAAIESDTDPGLKSAVSLSSKTNTVVSAGTSSHMNTNPSSDAVNNQKALNNDIGMTDSRKGVMLSGNAETDGLKRKNTETLPDPNNTEQFNSHNNRLDAVKMRSRATSKNSDIDSDRNSSKGADRKSRSVKVLAVIPDGSEVISNGVGYSSTNVAGVLSSCRSEIVVSDGVNDKSDRRKTRVMSKKTSYAAVETMEQSSTSTADSLVPKLSSSTSSSDSSELVVSDGKEDKTDRRKTKVLSTKTSNASVENMVQPSTSSADNLVDPKITKKVSRDLGKSEVEAGNEKPERSSTESGVDMIAATCAGSDRNSAAVKPKRVYASKNKRDEADTCASDDPLLSNISENKAKSKTNKSSGKQKENQNKEKLVNPSSINDRENVKVEASQPASGLSGHLVVPGAVLPKKAVARKANKKKDSGIVIEIKQEEHSAEFDSVLNSSDTSSASGLSGRSQKSGSVNSMTSTASDPSDEKNETRGRRARNTAVCYKEPSIGAKLRRGDDHTSSVYEGSPVKKQPRKSRKDTAVKSVTPGRKVLSEIDKN